MTHPVVAAFDFDGTLTRTDSVVPFLRLVGGRRRLVLGLGRRAPSVAAAVVRRDRDRLKALATDAVFRGVAQSRVDALARQHGRAIAVRGLRDDVVARLGWHLEHGHLVVIVSASYEPYVHVVAEALGVAHVVATRLAVDAAGVCTGAIDGPNCRAQEKVRRLERWLNAQGLARDGVELWAYGDSAGDRELLAWADHPVWVRETLDSVAPASA
jgi:phosphatidylglycerophosphatase C